MVIPLGTAARRWTPKKGDAMLTQALAIANGKGGVGKTSLTANVAAITAHSGWDTLVIDLDPQGNLGADLGYRQLGQSDDGMALSKAVQFGEPLDPPIKEVRRHLDAVPAGRRTRDLSKILQDRGARESAKAMDLALGLLVDEYDLILFDCPPGDDVLGDLGLSMSSALVIPVKYDTGSLDGLELMASRVRSLHTRDVNSELRLLGIALFDFNPTATSVRRQVEKEIRADFPQGVTIFERAIRHSQRASYDMRREGMVAIEYEAEARRERGRRLELLSLGSQFVRAAGPAKSTSAAGLAEDYAALTNEILQAFTAPPPAKETTGSHLEADAAA